MSIHKALQMTRDSLVVMRPSGSDIEVSTTLNPENTMLFKKAGIDYLGKCVLAESSTHKDFLLGRRLITASRGISSIFRPDELSRAVELAQ
jgi:hypothetical protein